MPLSKRGVREFILAGRLMLLLLLLLSVCGSWCREEREGREGREGEEERVGMCICMSVCVSATGVRDVNGVAVVAVAVAVVARRERVGVGRGVVEGEGEREDMETEEVRRRFFVVFLSVRFNNSLQV